jgi:hypothetical protein
MEKSTGRGTRKNIARANNQQKESRIKKKDTTTEG